MPVISPSGRRQEPGAIAKGHGRHLTRRWTLLLGAVVLIAGHVIFLSRLRHAGLSLAVISGLVLLAIVKHLGLLGPLYALIRRRLRT